MKNKSFPLVFAGFLGVSSALAPAADLYWSGTGAWDTTNQVWGTSSGGPYDQAIWSNGTPDSAVFEGTAGTVTLQEPITVGGLTFNTASYAIAGNGNTLTLASGTIINSTVGTNNATDPVINAALAGTSGFTKTGTGWLGLEATTSSLSGNINIQQGTLYTRHEALGTGGIVFTGNSTLTKVYNANRNFTQNISISDGVTATMSSASFYYNAYHAGVLSGGTTTTLNLSVGGNTEIQFNNTANTFTGKLIIGSGGTADNGGRAVFKSLADSSAIIQINNGLLRLANGGVSMSFANRQLEMLNNARLDNDSTNAGVTMSFAQDLSVKTGNNGRILYLTGVNTGDNTFSGVIGNSSTGTGATQVRKQENGKWILGSNNTYTGKTTVDAGTLEITSLKDVGSPSSVGQGSTLQLGYYTTSGTLRYAGAGDSTNRPIQINDYTNGASNTGSGIILNDGSGSLAFTASTFIPTNETVVANRSLQLGGSYTGSANEIQGIIQDIAPIAGKAIISVVKRNDASTWALRGTNAYTGSTTVSGGTLEIGGGGSLNSGSYAGLISIASSNSGTLRFNSTADQTLSGVISGAGSLVKDSTGVLTLTNTNDMTGAITVNGGILAIGGSGSINSVSAITLDGGTLDYTSSVGLAAPMTFTGGTLVGTNWTGSLDGLVIDGTRIISPGNSPGTANTGDQTWAGGGSYIWEINNATGTAGIDPGWDLLAGTGTLGITATSGNQYSILITSLDLANDPGQSTNFDDTTSYEWLIADFANPVTGFDATAFNVDTSAFQNAFTGTFGIARGDSVGGDSSQLFVTYSAVPEPAGLAILASGLIALDAVRRRRRV